MIKTKEKVDKVDKKNNYNLGFDNKFYKASSLVIIISILLTIVFSIYPIKSEIPITPSYEEQLLQKLQTKEGNLSKEEVEILLNIYGKYKILQMLFTQEFIEEEYTYEEFLLDYKELKDKLIFKIALLYDEKNLIGKNAVTKNKVILNILGSDNKAKLEYTKAIYKDSLKAVLNCLKYVVYGEIRKKYEPLYIFKLKDIEIKFYITYLYHIWTGHCIDYQKDFNIMLNKTNIVDTFSEFRRINIFLDIGFYVQKLNDLDLDYKKILTNNENLYFKLGEVIYCLRIIVKNNEYIIETYYPKNEIDLSSKKTIIEIKLNYKTYFYYEHKK
jgi:hypothetical protein